MENLNLVELLRDCPTGMELDCTVFDNITFDYVNTEQNRIYCKIDNRDTVWFTAKGCINLAPSAKCVIFPEGKTTWDGFVPPCQFKDGDVVVAEYDESIQLFLLKHFIRRRNANDHNGDCYFGWDFQRNELFKEGIWSFERLATEEEKQKLFDAIKANGYRWNAETKTLEKLVEPIFKVGDRIRCKEKTRWACTISRVEDRYYYVDGHPMCYTLPFGKQNEYELIPNKFDITTLKPFDKVLVRDFDNGIWDIEFFSRLLDGKHFKCLDVSYTQCIPYENNQHLLGTTNDCDDFYKTWEK